MTAESLGWQLRSALPPMRLHSVSLYNNEADVLWLSEGALGPDEHNVVVEAIEILKAEKGQFYTELGMEDGRIAIFLGIRGPRGELVGTVMILADMKSLSDGTQDRILTVPVKTIMQKMAVFLRKQFPQSSGGDTGVVTELPATSSAAESKTAAPAASAAATTKPQAPPAPELAPKQVDAMLTLELVDEPPPVAPVAPVGKSAPTLSAAPVNAPTLAAAPAAASKPAPVIKAVPRKHPPGSEARGAGAAALVTRPAADVEVLQFDANIQIPTARPAPAQPAATGADVLAFDSSIQIPTARATTPVEESAEIEVLNFDAELTIAPGKKIAIDPPVAKAAPAAPVVKAARPVAAPVIEPPVVKAAPVAKAAPPAPTIEPPVAKAATPAPVIEPPVAKAAPTPIAKPARASTSATSTTNRAIADAAAATSTTLKQLTGAPSIAAPPPVVPAAPKPVAAAAPKPVSTSATVSVPVLNTGSTTTSARVPKNTDEEVLLIQDTGAHQKIKLPEETAAVPELPAGPPPPALTVEETATDLTLFVQELIKLRSSGRTRRYEVLARSQRDAGRNEVPTAFISESAKGRDGSALDGLVVERLMKWLGEHGETIWDSEPASFSVNLSIGALEDAAFPERIAKLLEQYNVPAEYVGFEISEFACVQCRPAVQRFVDAIEKLGCFLVIDNFSFDSNMFELLGSKALRHVKIDPKLTTTAMKEKLPQALVVAILQACKVLGVHCVAKRIESQASLQWLTAVGCDFAQSFSLEKPTALDSLVSGKSIKALRE